MTLPDTSAWLFPDWQPHARIRTCITTRSGNWSPAPWQGFNLGLNCHDDSQRVTSARQHLAQLLGLNAIGWLTQVHGTKTITLTTSTPSCPDADASISHTTRVACAILTADCLPVLLARRDGSGIAAIHAGWRGLAAGIITQAAQQLAPQGEPLSAWLGPAICQQCYQVGTDVFNAFIRLRPEHRQAFITDGNHHYRLSLVQAAQQQLAALNIDTTASGLCTSCHNQRFYSYRKEHGNTGRFASLIWLDD